MSRPRPVARFLGETEASGGPFALLGVSPSAVTDDLVLSALDRQIDRINRHPECDTPEADEVRLAIHAAAAQLLDPVVRRHLIAKWTGTAVAHAPPPVSPAPSAVRPQSIKLLEADAILTLGIFGGWNQRSLRRLLTLAHARGFSSGDVARTLIGLSHRRRRAPRAGRPAAPVAPRKHARTREEFEAAERGASIAHASKPSPDTSTIRDISSLPAVPVSQTTGLPSSDQVDPAANLVRNAVLLGAIGLVGLAGAFVLILVLTRPSAAPAPVPPAPAPIAAAPAPSDTPPAPAPPPQRRPTPVAINPADITALPREFAACAAGAQLDPAAAITRFEATVATLGAAWPKLPRDQLVACHDSIVEFLYKLSAPDLALRAIDAIASGAAAIRAPEPPDDTRILPAVWSSGMLVRLTRERDLPATLKGSVENRINVALAQARPAIEQTFEAGAAAALSILPSILTPPASSAERAATDAAAWAQWADAVNALAAADAAIRLRLLLTGLETLLVSGPEPNVNRSIADAASALVVRITWRPQDESRRWLLRWFSDPRVSAADLNAVTSALATKSSAEGVDLTMVLSTSASDKLRADLRDRFATVWSLADAVTRDELTAAWVTAAREAVNTSYSSGDDNDELSSAAVLARLNEAASWSWRGDGGVAAKIVGDLLPPVRFARTPTAGPDAQNLELSDGAWGEKYLAARANLKLRRELIQQLTAAQRALGPVDAEVLVGEALAGSPADIRAPAAEAVRHFSESGAVINAVIERLPRLQRSAAASTLIETLTQRQLPSTRDPDWPIVARRILVERLLEVIAPETPFAVVDRLANLLALSYRSMASATPLPDDQRAIKTQPHAHLSAAQVWQSWRAAADAVVPTSPPPMPLDQIDRRRAGRLAQASGMVQRFAAEQAGVCELMAYVINAEQPARAEQIRLILAQFTDERRRASSILQQLNAAERAMTQLWLIRFREESDAS